ncbi:hypothetical protein KKG41_03055 [Patescibacteria group bacterium]|nr:hypothetical protein [Patescibacteria group bacterium]MBU1890250.1 hypothetical protein [Patescibacteria group bacterium]
MFAMVWMSFNSYYAFHYHKINRELDQIVEFAKDNESLYSDLIKNNCTDILMEFKKTGWLFGEPGERDCVADMRINSSRKIYFNENHQSCEDFFKVVYQIRCNFFHGSKEVSDEGNKKIIQWAYKYLNIFWKKFLNQNS